MGILSWIKRDKKNTPIIFHSKKDLSNEYVIRGEDMANANNLVDAMNYFDKALEINPQNDCAWGDKGLILTKQGKPEEALKSFSNAIAINPNSEITWHNQGLTQMKSKRFEEAIESFDNAIKIKDRYAKAWYNKGRALAIIGKTKLAQDCFDRARKLDPTLYTQLRKL
jgi:tetratricopeptide (TPR) repeat protein